MFAAVILLVVQRVRVRAVHQTYHLQTVVKHVICRKFVKHIIWKQSDSELELFLEKGGVGAEGPVGDYTLFSKEHYQDIR